MQQVLASSSLSFLVGLAVTFQSHDSLTELFLVSVSSRVLTIYMVLGDATG
jgi:hypothetical protein